MLIAGSIRTLQSLRNTLFVSLLAQVCLAAAIFGAAEGAPLAFFTMPIALFSLVAIDLTGWLKPPRLLLNLIALAAVGLAVAEFRNEGESRLLAGGHLIVYLTWTFLLQQKDLRRMWWMFALSVLQVALGAVLTVQLWYGAALFVYTVVSIGTMSLLSLTRAALLIDPQLLYPGGVPAEKGDLSAQISGGQSYSLNSVRTDEQGRWISPRFLAGGVMTFVLSLLVGLLFYIFIPRVWLGNLNLMADGNSSRSRIGYTDTVTLGETSDLMESYELVMEVELLDRRTDARLTEIEASQAIGADPLFRGQCLDSYDRDTKSWQAMQRYRIFPIGPTRRPPLQANIKLQPLDTTTMFYPGQIRGAFEPGSEEPLYLHEGTMTLIRSEDAPQGAPCSYTVNFYPPNLTLNPDEREANRQFLLKNSFGKGWNDLLSTPSPRISGLAQQLLRQARIDPRENAVQAARLLESYLRDSPEYRYSLRRTVQDRKVDPIEDFIFNRKSGHCEYFASGLALMLRGTGIPARLVSGFKGADYNFETGKLEVRALHAHVWVEAFVDGAWESFDATPSGREDEIAKKEQEKVESNPIVDQTRSFWFRGMNYSKSQQDQIVYAPIRRLTTWGTGQFALLMEGKLSLPVLGSLLGSSGSTASTTGKIAALVVLAGLGFGLVVLARWVSRHWKRRARERDLTQRRAITVEFYARFLKMMQRFGLAESPMLTPREFAQQAEQHFADRLGPSGLGGVSAKLAEAFYTVRYGETVLTHEELTEVERSLVSLENCLAVGANR